MNEMAEYCKSLYIEPFEKMFSDRKKQIYIARGYKRAFTILFLPFLELYLELQ